MYYKDIKIDEKNVIEHNKHILNVSGGDFGIIDPSTLSFAVDSVNDEKDPLQKATNFLYYAGRGHAFENGNKRTAFEVAKGICSSGAIELTIPQNDVISFVTGSVAQGKVTRNEVKEWLSSYSKLTEEHPDFNKITKENIEKDKELLKRLD
jgi:prophage maintenance system killer protein